MHYMCDVVGFYENMVELILFNRPTQGVEGMFSFQALILNPKRKQAVWFKGSDRN